MERLYARNPVMLAITDNVRMLPVKHAIAAFVNGIREALLDDPQETASILANIKRLREIFKEDGRKAA